METLTFGFLNKSHMYTSVIYKFLIIVPIKNSMSPTQNLIKIS